MAILLILSLLAVHMSNAQGPPGIFQFEATEIRVSEASGSAAVVIENTGNTAVSATVRVSTSANSTAHAGQDFVPLDGQQVRFSSGDSRKEVSIPIINDDEVEGEESFLVNLELHGPSRPSAALGERTTLTVIIEDNDSPPPAQDSPGIFQFEAKEITVSEDSGSVTVVIENTGNKAVSATVRVSTAANSTAHAEQDFDPLDGQLVTFLSGDPKKEVSIPIINDGEVEGEESFLVNLELHSPSLPSAKLGERTTLTVIIEDNDSPPPTQGVYLG